MHRLMRVHLTYYITWWCDVMWCDFLFFWEQNNGFYWIRSWYLSFLSGFSMTQYLLGSLFFFHVFVCLNYVATKKNPIKFAQTNTKRHVKGLKSIHFIIQIIHHAQICGKCSNWQMILNVLMKNSATLNIEYKILSEQWATELSWAEHHSVKDMHTSIQIADCVCANRGWCWRFLHEIHFDA